MTKISEKNFDTEPAKSDMLYWDACDKVYKMLVGMNEDIHTAMMTVEGARMELVGMYKGRRGFIAEYERAE